MMQPTRKIRMTALYAVFVLTSSLLAQPLTGSKTIGGTTPNYPTFTAAISALAANGVGAGGVVFNVRPGLYPESIVLHAISGASELNPIMFYASSDSVIVAPTGTSAVDAAITLSGASYCWFDGIHVRNGGTSVNDYVEYGYYVINESTVNGIVGSWHNTITNCAISMTKLAASSTAGVVQNYVPVPTSAAGTNSYNRYLNLKISNAINGIYVKGHATFHDSHIEIGSTSSALDDARRFTVGADVPDDIGSSQATDVLGIYCTNQDTVDIHHCDVRNLTTTSASSRAVGIYASNLYGTANFIRNNRIDKVRNNSTATATGSVYGIFASPPAGGNEVKIFNNFVSNLNQSRTTESTSMRLIGIYVTQGSTGISYVAHNSVYLNPNTIGATNSCINIGTYVAVLYNNVLVNLTPNQTTAKHFGIYKAGSTAITSDYNDVYVANTGNGFFGYHGVDCASLNAWQTASAGLDLHSLTATPNYVDAANGNLHIVPGVASAVNNAGVALDWVTVDIDNATRSSTNPDIGADEGAFGVAPGVPQNVLVVIDIGTVTLSWDAVAGASGYRIYRSSDPYFTPSAANLYATVTTLAEFVDSNPGDFNYYRVTAFNAE